MTVIVTGASRGIGRAVADRLHASGHEVIGIALKSSLDDRYDEPEFLIEEADVSSLEDIKAVYQKIKDKKISGLVNCAGIFDALPFSMVSSNRYYEVINVNLLGTINACSVFLKLMDPHIHTPIINISSIAAHIPNSTTIYTASKYAVEGFTSSLAKDLSSTKIRPNSICPGVIETDMYRAVFKDAPVLKSYIESQPIGIPLTVSHVADVVELLFDPKSNCIGGQSIQIG